MEDKELIEDEGAEDIKETTKEKIEDDLEQLIPTGPPRGESGYINRVPGSLGDEVPVDNLLYEYRFKCKHCGFEWTETREKEVVDK